MSLKFIAVFFLVITHTCFDTGLGMEDVITSNRDDLKFNSQRRRITPKPHPLKTIQVKDGDIIDCIDIYHQPAFNHPALKNHTIQIMPTRVPKTETLEDSSNKIASQVWHQYGSCPKGTIPIRRMLNKHEAARSSTHKGKPINHFMQQNAANGVTVQNHSFSVALTEGFSYSGAKGTIKVWNPYVEDGDYSSSQVMVKSGVLNTFETIQAGWAVNPTVYNDSNTRLFGYWSVDGMRSTGCFDLTCPGFVQTSSDIALGADIGIFYGAAITIQIHKDPYENNWWLLYNDKEVGYWPGELFSALKYHGTLVQWGGEVYSEKVGTHPHTGTNMGSGEFSDPILQRSGTITELRVEENSNPLKIPEFLFRSSDEWNCYDAYLINKEVQEPSFYYGGPGSRGNPRC